MIALAQASLAIAGNAAIDATKRLYRRGWISGGYTWRTGIGSSRFHLKLTVPSSFRHFLSGTMWRSSLPRQKGSFVRLATLLLCLTAFVGISFATAYGQTKTPPGNSAHSEASLSGVVTD